MSISTADSREELAVHALELLNDSDRDLDPAARRLLIETFSLEETRLFATEVLPALHDSAALPA